MFKKTIASVAAISLSLVSGVQADSLVEQVEELQYKTKRIITAVKANRAAIKVNNNDILTNKNSIESISSDVSLNSEKINENISNIEANTNAINAVSNQIANISTPASYDYKDYISQVSSKTFSLQTPGVTGCGDTEVRTYTRVVNGDVTNVNINRTRTSAGALCHNRSFNYVLTADSKKLVNKENNDLAGNVLSIDALSKPFTVATLSMIEGKQFGGATGIKRQDIGSSPVLTGAFVNTVTVEAAQSVTVPAGTFTDCLKVHTLRNSTSFGTFNRYSWICAGMGEVKRTQIDPTNLNVRFWKLTSYTP